MFRFAILFAGLFIGVSAFADFSKGDVIRLPIMDGTCTVQSVGPDGGLMVKLDGEAWSQYPAIPVGPNAAKTCRLIKKASSLDKAPSLPPSSAADVAS